MTRKYKGSGDPIKKTNNQIKASKKKMNRLETMMKFSGRNNYGKKSKLSFGGKTNRK